MIYWSNKPTEIIHLLPSPLARRTNTATVQTFSTSHYVMLQGRKTSIWVSWDFRWLTNSLPPSSLTIKQQPLKPRQRWFGQIAEETDCYVVLCHGSILQLYELLGSPYFPEPRRHPRGVIVFPSFFSPLTSLCYWWPLVCLSCVKGEVEAEKGLTQLC